MVILFPGGIESLSAFDTAVARIQETALGILVYTLIAVFLWPRDTSPALDTGSRKLIAVQRQLFPLSKPPRWQTSMPNWNVSNS